MIITNIVYAFCTFFTKTSTSRINLSFLHSNLQFMQSANVEKTIQNITIATPKTVQHSTFALQNDNSAYYILIP